MGGKVNEVESHLFYIWYLRRCWFIFVMKLIAKIYFTELYFKDIS